MSGGTVGNGTSVPELPDVEGFRRTAEAVQGAIVTRVEVCDRDVLRNTDDRELRAAISGRRIGAIHRRGKWLVLCTSGPEVLIHFGMTGTLLWQPDPRPHRHDRVVLVTRRGRLVYRDQRKLRGLWLARDPSEADEIIGDLGPDAYGITARRLESALSGQGRALKTVLMDQRVVAGLGNLTVDEVLWRARLHPEVRYDHLDTARRRSLHEAVGAVLRPAVRAGEVPSRPGWLTSQRTRRDAVCPRCGTALDRVRLGGRRTWFCPRCQPAPARLSDR